jgi:hypothetical protein
MIIQTSLAIGSTNFIGFDWTHEPTSLYWTSNFTTCREQFHDLVPIFRTSQDEFHDLNTSCGQHSSHNPQDCPLHLHWVCVTCFNVHYLKTKEEPSLLASGFEIL